MIISYIILAHKEPQQLSRLVERLYAPHTFFYIHIDRGVDIRPFEALLGAKERVIFLSQEKRVASIWGSLGVVKAALNGIREVVKDHRSGYALLLSGQCYPIKPNECIYSFLKENYGCNFIQGVELPDPRWPSSRLEKYAFFFSPRRADILEVEPLPDLSLKSLLKKFTLIKYAKVLLNYPLKAKLLLQKRRHPQNLKPYGGMAYWALPLQTLEFIIRFVAQNPAYLNFHSFTLYPDEMFFQTIVCNHFTNVREPVTFAYWADLNVISPQTFTADQFAFLKERKELFARKFDYAIDTKILDLIDKELHGYQLYHTSA